MGGRVYMWACMCVGVYICVWVCICVGVCMCVRGGGGGDT